MALRTRPGAFVGKLWRDASSPPAASAAVTIGQEPASRRHEQRQRQQFLQAGHQARGYWQEIVRWKVDPETGNRKYEDPELLAKRFREQVRSDGQALMDIDAWNDRHEKKWMKRRRLESKREYLAKKKQVMDLAKYIEFVNIDKGE